MPFVGRGRGRAGAGCELGGLLRQVGAGLESVTEGENAEIRTCDLYTCRDEAICTSCVEMEGILERSPIRRESKLTIRLRDEFCVRLPT